MNPASTLSEGDFILMTESRITTSRNARVTTCGGCIGHVLFLQLAVYGIKGKSGDESDGDYEKYKTASRITFQYIRRSHYLRRDEEQ